MKERQLRLLPLLWFILLQSLCIYQVQAKEAVGSNQGLEGSPKPSAAAQPSSQIILQDPASTSSEISEGAILVTQALSILRHLDRPSRYAPRKPLGLWASTSYYGIELFKLLFMNGPPADPTTSSEYSHDGPKSSLQEGVMLLKQAAHLNNSDALYLLGDMNFYGNFSHPKNYTAAFERYHQLASLDGNSSAQNMVGFMYATGLGDAVERDQARALLYHSFAARAGNTKSEMTLAFRHYSGISTARNCAEACRYYKRVAEKAIEFYRSGPPGGRAWPIELHSLPQRDGGIYGEGASVTSSGRNAQKAGPHSDAHAALDDVLEYLDLMSRKGDFKATFSLGRLHYDGTRDLPVNMKDARSYFMRVAKLYWTREGRIIQSERPGLDKVASKAAGYLGRMFLRGEGVQTSFDKALIWFGRGITNGDAGSLYGMGLMYLEGLGVPKNPGKAAEYFKAAADQDYENAQVALGKLYLDQGEISSAARYFEFAGRHDHIEALYHLAELYDQGVGRERSCSFATQYYKAVAERAEPIHSSFTEANQALAAGDLELALVEYMMAAEQGYKVAQVNVAYLLDQEKSNLQVPAIMHSVLPFKKTRNSILQNAALGLIYWTRSAKQHDIDAMVKMGDYYLKGIGAEVDMEKAAACYTAASDTSQSAQAFYNLGWMHENGIGLTQDFHLAKRYYDQALETNDEAYLPVTLSLFKLRLRSFWNTISYGSINSIRDEPVEQKEWSLSEWISNFLKDDHPYYHDGDYEKDDLAAFTDPDRDMPGGDGNGVYDDLIDDSMVESLLIIGLIALLVFLVWYRQQRQVAHRRVVDAARAQQGEAPMGAGQAEDRGMFPQPGDPAFNDWAAGGIGH